MLGMLLTKWTIRLALACYVAYLAGWLSRLNSRWPRTVLAIWTLGCFLFTVHVACAFHFFHQWSHAIAWRFTAERTKQLLGVEFGDGIYFSYLFLVLWVLDVSWLWLSFCLRTSVANGKPRGSPASPATAGATAVPQVLNWQWETPGWRVLVHVFLLFIAVNGAIVFEAGPTRWAGIAACLALFGLGVRRGYN